MSRAAVVLAVLLLAGCASVPVVEIPITQLALQYADARAQYATAYVYLAEACKGGALKPDACTALAAAHARAQGIRAQVETMIADPKRPFDPALLRTYLGEATSLVGMAAGLLGKGALGIP